MAGPFGIEAFVQERWFNFRMFFCFQFCHLLTNITEFPQKCPKIIYKIVYKIVPKTDPGTVLKLSPKLSSKWGDQFISLPWRDCLALKLVSFCPGTVN